MASVKFIKPKFIYSKNFIMYSDSLISKINELEFWLESAKGSPFKLPLRLAGYLLLILFKNGEEIDRFAGALSYEELREFIGG